MDGNPALECSGFEGLEGIGFGDLWLAVRALRAVGVQGGLSTVSISFLSASQGFEQVLCICGVEAQVMFRP